MAKEWSWGTIGDSMDYGKFLQLMNRRMLALTGSIEALFSGQKLSTRTVTAATTLTDSDFTLYANATGGAFSVALPDATKRFGRTFCIMKTDGSANAVTIDPYSTQTVNGSATLALSAQYAVKWIQSDGSNWFVLSGS